MFHYANMASGHMSEHTLLGSIHIEIRTNYHNKNFALRLALKERFEGTLKRSVAKIVILDQRNKEAAFEGNFDSFRRKCVIFCRLEIKTS